MTPTPDAPGLQLPETFPLFVVYTNTDLTEGRGYQYPIAWAESRATAVRLAHKKGVMGSDAEVCEMVGLKVGNCRYGPVRIERPTEEDTARDAAVKARREAIEKAKQAGLSDEDLAAIIGAKR